MLTSLRWLNRYLDPGTVTADDAEHLLTHAGFPVESREPLSTGDVKLDVELTSNRGDCLCHVGLAREAAAASNRKLVMPTANLPAPTAGSVTTLTNIENQVGALCPRFTAQVITGVKVGPSPAWLREALEAVGQRSINNVVDITNYVLLELGHPSHVFDLNTLADKRLVIRFAHAGEKLAGLDGKAHTLQPSDMVVADAKSAQSVAGVVGGVATGVTEKTTDVLLEMATWDPATIRRTARRLDTRTDASHRFERFVDPRDIDFAAKRAAALIIEVAGGKLADGVIDVWGAPKQPRREITLRLDRCEHILGLRVPPETIIRLLSSIGVDVTPTGQSLRCTVPHHRPDLTREIDLIEEVARLHGFDKFEVTPTIATRLDMAHPAEWERREHCTDVVSAALCGMGFYETVTFSFATKQDAQAFIPAGLRAVKIDEERRKDMPYTRPSVLIGLLNCRRGNRDAGVHVTGGVRLFEIASVFAEHDDGEQFARKTIENVNVGIVMDAPSDDASFDTLSAASRAIRGVVERVVASAGGANVKLDVEPVASVVPALTSGTAAKLSINGEPLGYLGLIVGKDAQRWGLDAPVAVAELSMARLIALYPPAARAHELPAFPSIDRDLSVVVDESLPWRQLEELIDGAKLPLMEARSFVGTYRGKQLGSGKKSVTFRMTFRDHQRTLRHEEVDPQVSTLVALLKEKVGAELRA